MITYEEFDRIEPILISEFSEATGLHCSIRRVWEEDKNQTTTQILVRAFEAPREARQKVLNVQVGIYGHGTSTIQEIHQIGNILEAVIVGLPLKKNHIKFTGEITREDTISENNAWGSILTFRAILGASQTKTLTL